MKQIPNILSFLRLLMIPLFVYTYFEYQALPYSMIAAGVYIVAWATDVLDGYLARRNNWITDIGKILDPLADKLMQVTAAVCFTVDNRIFLLVLVPMVIKEACMLIGGMLVIKRTKKVVQALWYGKAATVVLFGFAFFRIIFRNSLTFDTVASIGMLCAMLFAFVMYFIKVFKAK